MMANSNSKAFDKFIEYQVQFAIEMRQTATEEFAASSRWLSASLFALNGGAIITLASIQNYPRDYLRESGFIFLIGVSLCFLMVIFGQISCHKKARFLNYRGNRLIQLLDPSAPLDTGIEEETKVLPVLRRWDIGGQLMGLGSCVAFFIGCWRASAGL